MKETEYLEYRDSIENNEHLDVFKNSNAVVVIGRDGKLEELNVDINSYHFDALYDRFSYFPDAIKQNEFKIACTAAQEEFIILVVDKIGFSTFLPDIFSIKQKETLFRLLSKINSSYKVFAAIISSKFSLTEEILELNDGNPLNIKELLDELRMIPVELVEDKKMR